MAVTGVIIIGSGDDLYAFGGLLDFFNVNDMRLYNLSGN